MKTIKSCFAALAILFASCDSEIISFSDIQEQNEVVVGDIHEQIIGKTYIGFADGKADGYKVVIISETSLTWSDMSGGWDLMGVDYMVLDYTMNGNTIEFSGSKSYYGSFESPAYFGDGSNLGDSRIYVATDISFVGSFQDADTLVCGNGTVNDSGCGTPRITDLADMKLNLQQ
ncbi:MAG: hypothetical protein SNH79_07205 [Rikenellaceae bacterium]